MPFSSIKNATGTSTRDSIAVVAAMEVRMKKAINNKLPKGILENTKGIVLNNNPGPAPGSMPKVNTTGKIAVPARSETMLSDRATLADVAIIILFSKIAAVGYHSAHSRESLKCQAQCR